MQKVSQRTTYALGMLSRHMGTETAEYSTMLINLEHNYVSRREQMFISVAWKCHLGLSHVHLSRLNARTNDGDVIAMSCCGASLL